MIYLTLNQFIGNVDPSTIKISYYGFNKSWYISGFNSELGEVVLCPTRDIFDFRFFKTLDSAFNLIKTNFKLNEVKVCYEQFYSS